MEGWADFTQDIRNFYGVDMACLDNLYRREQKEYYLETSAWADIHPSQLLGPACCFKEYDLLHVTLEELAAPLQVGPAMVLSCLVTRDGVAVALFSGMGGCHMGHTIWPICNLCRGERHVGKVDETY